MYIVYPRYFFPHTMKFALIVLCSSQPQGCTIPALHLSQLLQARGSPACPQALSCAQLDTQMLAPAVLNSLRNFSGR